MKTLTINTNSLLNAVAVANNFMSKDGDFAGKIVLVGTDGKLEVKASNNEQTIIFKDIDFVSSDLTDNNFFAFSIDGKKMLTVLKAAKTDEIHIELHSEQIIVKSARSKVKIETLANTQDIEIAKGNGHTFDISSQVSSMEQVLHAVDTNNPRFEINGVLLQAKNGIFNIVGTDTKRLASITSETSLSDIDVIVPKKGIETIVKLFKGFNISAEIDNVSLSVHTESVSYSTKLINGKYPQWQRIVPQSITQSVSISKHSFELLIREASIFNPEIIIDISDNKIRLTDFDGATEVEDDFTSSNENIKFGVNAKSLIDFLASYDEENVQICFNESNMPVMLVANPEYKEIIMPIIMPEIEEDVQNAA